MKTIKIPPPIRLTFLDGSLAPASDSNPLSFWQFSFDRLADISSVDLDTLMQVIKIKKIFTDARDRKAATFEMELADWRLIRDKAVKPAHPYNTSVAHCLVPFIQAFDQAAGD